MEIIKLPVESLKPYKNNAKIHTPKQIEHIKNSILKFGFNDPIGIWGDNNEMVEGHGRLDAVKELGYKEVECIRLDHLSDEDRRAYMLTHNQTTMETGFDFALLDAELKNLFDADINMSDFGFDFDSDDSESDDEYTKKIKSPQYEITGEEVSLADLTIETKYNELISEINGSGLP